MPVDATCRMRPGLRPGAGLTMIRWSQEIGLPSRPSAIARDAVGAGRPFGGDGELQRGVPAAALDRALIRRVLPARRLALDRQHRRFRGAVADDLDPEVLGGRADMQRHRLAAPIGEAGRVAPDLAALAVHAGIFVIMAEHRLMPLFRRQAKVGKRARQGMHGGVDRAGHAATIDSKPPRRASKNATWPSKSNARGSNGAPRTAAPGAHPIKFF